MIHALATLAPLVAPAPPVAASPVALVRPAQDEDLQLRWYDIRSIPTAKDMEGEGVIMGLPITMSAIDSLEPGSYDVPLPDDVQLDVEETIVAIERSIEADPEAYVDTLDLFNGRLRVAGNERAQAITARVVSALRAISADSANVEIVRIPAGRLRAGLGPLLSSEEAGAAIESLADVPSLVAPIPMGRKARLGSERSTAFLADYDVEVAQAVMVADPVVSVVRTGLDIGLRVDRAADGRRTIVRVWGRDTRLRTPIRKRAQEGFAGAEIELPEADTGIFAGSGLVEPGGALLIQCGGAAGDILVRVLPEAGGGQSAESITLGEHLLGQMRPDPPYFSVAEPSNGWSVPDVSLAEATSPWYDGRVTARDFVDEVLGLQRVSSSLVPFGGTALFVGADDLRSELRTGFDEYAAAAPVHTFAVEAAHALLTPEETAALMGSGDVDGFVRRATRVQGAVMEGDAMVLLGGAEAAYLKDYDSQIAGGSTIQDPIISSVFGGLGLWVSPLSATESGGLRAWMDIRRQTFEGTLREIPVSNFRVGVPEGSEPYPRASGVYTTDLTVEMPETHRASSRSVVTLEPDTWRLVTVQPLAGTDRTLVLAARARAVR